MALRIASKRIINNFFSENRLLCQYLAISTGVSAIVFAGNSYNNDYDHRYKIYQNSLSISLKFFPFVNLILLPCYTFYYIGEGFYYSRSASRSSLRRYF
jgi:hypothetical protein